MPDDLLRPTVGAGVDISARPWRLMSQTYVAFFGGVIASTAVTYLNAGRLGVDAGRRRLILLTGLVGQLAVIGLFLALYDGGSGNTYSVRLPLRVTAVLCCLVQLRLQRPMDRAFQLRGAEYGSLWSVGFACVGCGLLAEVLLLVLMAGLT